MSEIEMAVKWFEYRGVTTHLVNDEDLYIKVQMLEVLVASSEIAYRADLYKSEVNCEQV